jgi:hypothetical protein
MMNGIFGNDWTGSYAPTGLCSVFCFPFPTAYTVGYHLSPLQGLK